MAFAVQAANMLRSQYPSACLHFEIAPHMLFGTSAIFGATAEL